MQRPLGLTPMPPHAYELEHARVPVVSRRRRRLGWATMAVASSMLGLFFGAGMEAASAEDLVELSRGPDGKPGPVFRGEILGIAQGKLTIRRADGREDAVPWARVAQYRTTWPAGLAAADRLRDERRYDDALSAYLAAAQTEPRGWVKEVIKARAIVCFREQQLPIRAGDLFLSMYRYDHETPHFNAIPLAWIPAQLATEREDSKLRDHTLKWLADADHPGSVLLGASWLITVGEPGRAIAALQTLTQNADKRIALLSEAQLWRARIVQAKESDVAGWERMPPRLPAPLRAGPHFTLGLAWQQCQQPERAALAFLRVPIEHPDQTTLAAIALELAAQQLDQLQRPVEAARLRQERATRFGGK
ncbi:MAG: hypothetical protein RLY70_1872 [Planctomycetota bacterium]